MNRNELEKTAKIFAEASTANGNPIWFLGTNGDTRLRVYIRNDANSTTPSLDLENGYKFFDNTWHHVEWTDNNGTTALYLDGVQDPTNFNYTAAALTPNKTSIGSQ